MNWPQERKNELAAIIKGNPNVTSDEVIRSFPQFSVYGTEAVGRRLRRTLHPDKPKERSNMLGLDDLETSILKRLQSKSYTLTDLCSAVDRGPVSVQKSIETLQKKGYKTELFGEEARMSASSPTGFTRIPLEHFKDGKWFRHGLVSDTHICSTYQRLDVLNAAYDHFEAEGIREVFHAGNWIDGEARFNKHELLTAPGFENQVKYFLDNYPNKVSINTRIISGDDHEGFYQQSFGVDVGRRLEQTARSRGRNDIFNLGYAEVDIPFAAKKGGKEAILRVVHAGGGSSYATSYSVQKLVESYSGGSRPQILYVGHYHKSEFLHYRNTAIIQAGCMEDQSLFMRKKKLSAHVGFWTVSFQVDSDGAVTRFNPEYFPFYDVGYYANRYGFDDAVRVA